MPLAEYGGTLGVKRAAHLLRRATFGATKAQIDVFAQLTPAQAIQRLFHQTLPDARPPIDPKTGSEWMTNGTTDANSRESDLENYLLGWFVGQMMSAGVPGDLSLAYSAREKIIFFLHTHFTTIRTKVSSTRALYFQNQLFRQFALDGIAAPEFNIKELTVKISVDNAMLRLLDGNLNVRGNPNENYARELLELYTIGRGLEGTLPPTLNQGDYYVFKEQDVQAAARVLSGWDFDNTFNNIDPETALPRGRVRGNAMNASSHDNQVKTFSDRFNNATIQPDPLLLNGGAATEESALDEIRQLIDLIYSKPETAKNICWKIYRFFVHAPHERFEAGNTVARIDAEIITPMAEYLKTSHYKLQPVIENLLCSEHFYDSSNTNVTDDNYGGIIKSPLDLVIGTLRTFSISLPDPVTEATAFYEATTEIVGTIDSLGMHFYEPYDVAGYEAYHQFPIYHRFWITPNSLAKRYDFIRSIITGENEMFQVNVSDYVRSNFNAVAADPNTLIASIATYFFPVADNLSFDDATDANAGLTAKRLNYFKERFLQDFDEAYWANNWSTNGREVNNWLKVLFNAMLQTPEYQLA
jgi:uncharacterized protein (DUF1800 family)